MIIVFALTECAEAQEILDNFLSRIDSSILEDIDLVLHCKSVEKWRLYQACAKKGKFNAEKCTHKIKKEVQDIVAKTYTLENYSLHFKGIKKGCFELIYHISKAVMSYLLEIEVTSSIMAEFATHDIMHLTSHWQHNFIWNINIFSYYNGE